MAITRSLFNPYSTMKQYLKLLTACALGLTMALSLANAQETTKTEETTTTTVTKEEASSLKNQYAAANELNKKIASLLADAPNMSQSAFEESMDKLLGEAKDLSDQMKRNPSTEEQQQILARSIVAAQKTLTGLKEGTMTKAQAVQSIRKLRAPLNQTLTGIASFLRSNGYGALLAAYLDTLKSPDNSIISPEA